MTIRNLTGLSQIADRYDAFILDLWGVIHDGVTPYPHAAATLRALRAAGKRTVLLSNAPRRAFALVDGLSAMGIPRDLYDHVMSSGEAVHGELACRRDPWYARLGRRCLHVGPDRDRNIFAGLDLDIVERPDEADFVLNTGPDRFDETVDDYHAVLKACADRRLPMVCANPDLVVIREGRRVICAGALAERYEALGGEVSYRGKPDPAIYALCLELLGVADRQRVAGVGDALHTDVAGAAAAGIDSIFVTSGIHGEELGVTEYGETADLKRVAEVAAAHNQRPTAAIAAFVW